ncbi:MAG: alpha/beta hydrolase [Lachnospiraceae bacterium]|nr:alpha/beta hydrolase [Lachnospiraceae bacterium]MDE7179130.1 alpha/beta hydrolase [Lachnospiraceae bacterium]
MWSALHTARAIANATLPYYEQGDNEEQIGLCKEILRNGISAKEAFDKSMSIDLYEEVQRYCHMTCGDYEREYFSKHAKNSRTEVLSGCAHLSWFEQPERYTELIYGFVRSH